MPPRGRQFQWLEKYTALATARIFDVHLVNHLFCLKGPDHIFRIRENIESIIHWPDKLVTRPQQDRAELEKLVIRAQQVRVELCVQADEAGMLFLTPSASLQAIRPLRLRF
jgi:hypothetical protein